MKLLLKDQFSPSDSNQEENLKVIMAPAMDCYCLSSEHVAVQPGLGDLFSTHFLP